MDTYEFKGIYLATQTFQSLTKITLGFLTKISFTPILYHPGGFFWIFRQAQGTVTVFQPEWNDIKKTCKNYQNPVKSYCFFWIISICSILAGKQQSKPIT